MAKMAQEEEGGLFFLKTQRGRPSAVFQGHRYVHHRITKAGVQYRCWRKNPPHACRALMTVSGRSIIIPPTLHNHDSDWGHIKSLEAISKILKEAEAAPNVIPSVIIRNEISKLDEEALVCLPKRLALKRRVERVQAKDRPALPTSFDDIQTLPEKYRTMEGKRWLLKDTGGRDRQLIFASDEGLRSLSRSSYWLSDGTYKARPRIAYQLYVVHARVVNGERTHVIPAVFSMMKTKSEAAYTTLFQTIRDSLPFGNGPLFFSTDFELGAMNAARNVFPSVSLAGCLFHLSQSFFRVLQKEGLQKYYSSRDSQIRLDFHMLIGLAFVPTEDVPDTFDALADVVDKGLEPVVSFIHQYYVHGQQVGKRSVPPRFPPSTWNCYERVLGGLPRTTNSCEGWHSKLAKIVRRWHPSLFQFLEELMLEEGDARSQRLRMEVGDSPPRKANEYAKLDKRVYRVVETYAEYKKEKSVLRYLKAVGLAFSGSLFVNDDVENEEVDGSESPIPLKRRKTSPPQTPPSNNSNRSPPPVPQSPEGPENCEAEVPRLFRPPNAAWQRRKCQELGVKYIKASSIKGKKNNEYKTAQPPQKILAIAGDGSCFFRALSYALTGVQDYHSDIRRVICDDIQKRDGFLNPKTRRLESGDAYLKRTKMRILGTWATTDEIFAAARVLEVVVVVWALHGNRGHQWLPYGDDADVEIYLDNSHGNHFDVVLKV